MTKVSIDAMQQLAQASNWHRQKLAQFEEANEALTLAGKSLDRARINYAKVNPPPLAGQTVAIGTYPDMKAGVVQIWEGPAGVVTAPHVAEIGEWVVLGADNVCWPLEGDWRPVDAPKPVTGRRWTLTDEAGNVIATGTGIIRYDDA